MKHLHTICPYVSVEKDESIFAFGMSPQEVAAVDAKIFEIKEDAANRWVLERRGGYSTEFVDGKLAAVALRIDPGHNGFTVGGVDISDADGVMRLRNQYEHCVFADGESVLFPSLGVLVSITPFCDGWDMPRPGVFNREIVAFAKNRLAHYYGKANVIGLRPLEGITVGGKCVQFAVPPQEVHAVLGAPPYTWKNYGSHKHIVEYYGGRGFRLNYRHYAVSYQYDEAMPLHMVQVIEADGWQVEIDGICVFEDDKLTEMRARYEHVVSKKGKAVAFPTLGIFSIGCGEKKNNRNGGEGKVLYLGNAEALASWIGRIDMWD